MDFRYKCYLQRFFSSIPKGEKLNYLFQKHVTRSMPVSEEKFLRKVNNAFQHYTNFKTYNTLDKIENRYYEFGAGWDLIIPLSVSFLQFEVYCVDLRKLIFLELINDSIEKFNTLRPSLPFTIQEKSRVKNIKTLKDRFKLHYFAPKDARNTGFPDNYFDFISSTVTLEHIPPDSISGIFKECYRILKKGGIISMFIDYKDHWSYFDRSISIYNFLKFSSSQWKKYNPSLHYQNRLRHSDYMKLISQTSFKVVKHVPYLPDDENIETLKKIKLSEEFKAYAIDDLGIKGAEIVLMK